MSSHVYVNDDIRSAIKKSIKPDDSVVVNMGSWVWKSFVESEINSHVDDNKLVYML